MRLAAVAAHFGRELDRAVAKVAGIVESARGDGVDLLVLPHGTLGGYLSDLHNPGREPDLLPPGIAANGPQVRAVAEMAGSMTVCLGFTELHEGHRYNAAVCVSEGAVLGRHRKVHQSAGEASVYSAGDRFRAFDTPIGRLGMLIDYDKTFPESARSLALDGARVIACLSAWPASVTDRATRMTQDRQSRLFDLYDGARAAENQVVVVSSNQTGVMGGLRFLGQAKVVGPGGEVLARTWTKGGLACADVDVGHEISRSRRVLHHLEERRPDTYAI